MRRDLLITAILFTAIGFVGGYVYSQQTVSSSLRPVVQAPPTTLPGEQADTSLPQGHPPLDVAQQWRTLQEQADNNPRDPRAALALADFLYDLQRWEQAVFWYRRTLELDPKNTDARTDLATCYYHLKRFEEALADFGRALELEPNKPQALYGLALARLHGKQDRAGALQAYEQLRRSHPDFPGVELLARELEPGGVRR